MEAFGEHLRRWRRERSLSQLALATLTGTSARHLSFLESGRSVPGRNMVLRLAEALGVPPFERDRALEAAGLPPLHRQAAPDARGRPALERAVATLLRGHDPLPAFAVDTDWHLLGCNGGGERVLGLLGASPSSFAGEAPDAAAPTLVDLLAAHADSGAILNWNEVAALLLKRARGELARRADPSASLVAGIERLALLHEARTAGGGVPSAGGEPNGAMAVGAESRPFGVVDASSSATTPVTVPLRLRAAEVTLSLVTTIAEFGGIDYLDIDAPRVELMFPGDEITRLWFETDD